MRLLLSCDGCRSTAVINCQGCRPGQPEHQPGCPVGDLDAALNCTPGSACCQQDHHHGQAANACPGARMNHPGASCPHPDPKSCLAVTPAGTACPGGHCAKGVPGCTVCRPITITILDLGVLAVS